MTLDTHERCSDRTAEAMLKIEAELGHRVDIVVMVQGDEPMVTPEMVEQAIGPHGCRPCHPGGEPHGRHQASGGV